MTFVSKTELAQRYFPNVADRSALNKLMSLITSDTPLLHSLIELGYRKEQRYFSPAQLSLIFQRFGEP
ncbi:MAG: DUF4248 domain-containing protein [Prevotellaceae bacterium]|nr:DUF4248 domain-containing protein [Candidatus Minthosoma equi]